MITISIKDTHGNECELGDVLVLHFPNPKVKYFGVLVYDPKDYCFRVSDMFDGWHAIHPSYMTIERLCKFEDRPAVKKELGNVEVQDVKEFDKIYNICL